MTAEIRYLCRHMPQEIVWADDAMMQDYIDDEMARDRARWTAHRLDQANAKVGAYAPIYDDTDRTWTIRYAGGIAAMLTLWGIYECAVLP